MDCRIDSACNKEIPKQPGAPESKSDCDWRPDYNLSTPLAREWHAESQKRRLLPLQVDKDCMYTARFGDSLWTIAERSLRDQGRNHKDQQLIRDQIGRLVDANKAAYPSLDCNPDLVKTGWKLRIPACAEEKPPVAPPERPPVKPCPPERPPVQPCPPERPPVKPCPPERPPVQPCPPPERPVYPCPPPRPPVYEYCPPERPPVQPCPPPERPVYPCPPPRPPVYEYCPPAPCRPVRPVCPPDNHWYPQQRWNGVESYYDRGRWSQPAPYYYWEGPPVARGPGYVVVPFVRYGYEYRW